MTKNSDFTEIEERLVELFERDGLTPEVIYLSQLIDKLILEEQKKLMDRTEKL